MAIEPITSLAKISAADPIGPSSDFAGYFQGSARPRSAWSVGPEMELFGFTKLSLARIDPDQVQSVIRGFSSDTVNAETEDGFIVAARLASAAGRGRITLEPGGQIEYSGDCRTSLSDVERALNDFVGQLRAIGGRLGIIFIASGFDPVRSIGEQKWIPKKRYDIMRPYLGARGRLAWDMMCRTAAIQVNLDYSDTTDLARKFILANRLGPIAAAIFANSPFEQGKLSGYKSTRYRAWLDTDPDRTGLSPLALEDDFSIERFIENVRSVPMFFIRRESGYIDLAGHSFDAFLAGGVNGQMPVFQDFTDHLSTIFTEARLKPHIEQRSMDSGPVEMVMAALAFWKGIMYQPDALEGALALAPKLSRGEFTRLQLEVARYGLQARLDRLSVMKLAEAAIELAQAGLKSIAPDEAQYLGVLDERVRREQVCSADILIRNYRGSWNGDARRAVEYLQV